MEARVSGSRGGSGDHRRRSGTSAGGKGSLSAGRVGVRSLYRSGVTCWWLLVPAVASIAASVALTFSPLPYAGFALVGLRLIGRNRAEAAAA